MNHQIATSKKETSSVLEGGGLQTQQADHDDQGLETQALYI